MRMSIIFMTPSFFSKLEDFQKRVQVIYDVHEDVPNQVRSKYWIPGFIRPLVSAGVKMVEMSVAKHLSSIVTVVDSIANRFDKVNKHVVQIRNYPRLEELPES